MSLDDFLDKPDLAEIKSYWEWVMDNHPRIRAGSSLKNYWRVLQMHILDRTDDQVSCTIT